MFTDYSLQPIVSSYVYKKKPEEVIECCKECILWHFTVLSDNPSASTRCSNRTINSFIIIIFLDIWHIKIYYIKRAYNCLCMFS